MRNIQSDGVAEDLIRSFIQFGCAESHVKTLIEKYEAELASGLVEDTETKFSMITELTEELNSLAEMRRSIMLSLGGMYTMNKDAWCLAKHVCVGAYNAFEAYQASDDDPELYLLWIDANKRAIKALTLFLGIEPLECASCFADALKQKHASKSDGNVV